MHARGTASAGRKDGPHATPPAAPADANGSLEYLDLEFLDRDARARLYPHALDAAAAQRCFTRLHETVHWQQQRVRMFGREHPQPRLSAWYGEHTAIYRYGGLTLQPRPWIDALAMPRALCEAIAGVRFNSVLANLYRDGEDTVGWHSDDEPELGDAPVIASVSLGACRRFELREKHGPRRVRLDLPPGSVLVMSGSCQAQWQHRLPRARRVREARINLTFRQIRR